MQILHVCITWASLCPSVLDLSWTDCAVTDWMMECRWDVNPGLSENVPAEYTRFPRFLFTRSAKDWPVLALQPTFFFNDDTISADEGCTILIHRRARACATYLISSATCKLLTGLHKIFSQILTQFKTIVQSFQKGEKRTFTSKL